jgi:hypothetical protein
MAAVSDSSALKTIDLGLGCCNWFGRRGKNYLPYLALGIVRKSRPIVLRDWMCVYRNGCPVCLRARLER